MTAKNRIAANYPPIIWQQCGRAYTIEPNFLDPAVLGCRSALVISDEAYRHAPDPICNVSVFLQKEILF
jgi:hypothetical protein